MKYVMRKAISVLYRTAWKYMMNYAKCHSETTERCKQKATDMWQELLLPNSLALQLLKGEVELIYFSL
jgi:hypothetical protein